MSTSWLRPFVEYFAGRGRTLDRYFAAVHAAPEVVWSDDAWLSKRQLYSWLNSVAEGERMAALGFVVGDRFAVSDLGAIGAGMQEAETLGGALQRFARLLPRHVEGNRVWLEEGDQGDVWLFNEIRDRRRGESDIADHAGVMALINCIRLGAGPGWYPARATLQAPATGAYREVEGLVTCEFEFGADATGVAFPAWLLAEPLVEGHGDCGSRSSDKTGLLPPEEQVHQKLRRLLRSVVGVGGVLPSVHLAAEMARSSSRTLHRRLRDAGVTYQELLDEVRYERATEALINSDVSVKELAFELGFSGANNFVRYFRRMAGVTPSEFRDRGPGTSGAPHDTAGQPAGGR